MYNKVWSIFTSFLVLTNYFGGGAKLANKLVVRGAGFNQHIVKNLMVKQVSIGFLPDIRASKKESNSVGLRSNMHANNWMSEWNGEDCNGITLFRMMTLFFCL